MKHNKLLSFISFTIINYFILALISLAISYLVSFTLKDTTFLVGLIVFISQLFINISGDPTGVSLQSLGSINAQYTSEINFKATEHESNNKPVLNIKKLLKSTLLFSSMLILITAHYL